LTMEKGKGRSEKGRKSIRPHVHKRTSHKKSIRAQEHRRTGRAGGESPEK